MPRTETSSHASAGLVVSIAVLVWFGIGALYVSARGSVRPALGDVKPAAASLSDAVAPGE